MKTREEIRDFLKGDLESLIKGFTENPGGTDDLQPGYYQERLNHLDEILPIYMAGKIRIELEMMSHFPNWEELENKWDNEPGRIINVQDLVRRGINTTYIDPNTAMQHLETFLSEFMEELGESIPNYDETEVNDVKLLKAQRGIDALGAYGIPVMIPPTRNIEVGEATYSNAYDKARSKIPDVVDGIRKSVTTDNTRDGFKDTTLEDIK